jgi:predicted  nucleic acid-binding Zn-ribbon protein
MKIEKLEKELQAISDEDLFAILNIISEEVKRRNNMKSPSISNIRDRSIEENVKAVLSALANFGIGFKKNE